MRFHYSDAESDWAAVAPGARNYWQRLAARTQGVLTPGNAVSVIGLALVVAGLIACLGRHNALGLGLVIAGRLADIADGFVADRTGTKSPLGEAVDATCDKLGAFGALIIFAVSGLLPWLVALLIGVQNGTNSVIAFIGKLRRRPVHPTAAGKLATVGEWLTILLFAGVFASHWALPAITAGAYSLAVVALALGWFATAQYLRMLASSRR